MVHAYDPVTSLEFIKLSIKYIRRLPRLDKKSIVVIAVLINYLIVIKHLKTFFHNGFHNGVLHFILKALLGLLLFYNKLDISIIQRKDIVG